jgi:hypothetical protein
MTSSDPFQAEPAAVKNTVCFHSLQKICGTSWFESATGSGTSAEPGKKRRKRALIHADKDSNERKHQAARIEARFARRNHSSSSSRYVARAAFGRAIVTIQKFPGKSGCCLRTISRSRRRTRLRTTAEPMRFDVTKPARSGFRSVRPALRTGSGPGSTLKMRKAPRCERPSSFIRSNSDDWMSRRDLGKERARVMFNLTRDPPFCRERRCRPIGSQRLPYNIRARRPKSPPAKLRRRNKNRYR